MISKIRRKLTFANVLSVIAVFLALGGTAFAISLGKNSVGSKQLKKGAVKTADLKNKAVTLAKLADSAKPPTVGPVAYAKVAQNGGVSQASNVTGVFRLAAGVYCFDLAFAAQNGVASPDAAVNTTSDLSVQVPGNNICPTPFRDATVFGNGGVADRGFFALFH